MKPKNLVRSLLVLIFAAAVTACATAGSQGQPVPTLPPVLDTSEVTAEGRLEPIHFADVSPATGGLVSEVLVREGDPVRAGDLIARIQDSKATTLESAQANAAEELSSAYAAVREAQNALDAYPMPKVFVGMTAEQATRTWLQRLDTARANFAPYADSSRKGYKWNHRFVGLPPRILFDTNEFRGEALEYKKQVDVGWVYYRRACTWLELESKLESAKARLSDAQRSSDNLQDTSFATGTAGTRGALADAELRSPIDGTITKLDLKPGKYVEAGKPVATIGDLSGWIVKTTNLSEIDVVDLHPEQRVSVTFDALPGQSFRGTVTEVAQNYTVRQGDIYYEVAILLAGKSPEMRWGLTAQVTFIK